MVSTRVILAIALVVLMASFDVEGAYRKPPFNGSIFGKRSNTITDSEPMNRAMSAMCELASETCNAWWVHQDSN